MEPAKEDTVLQKTSKKFIKCKLCTKIVITNSYQEHLAKSHKITDNFEDLDLHSPSPTKNKSSPTKNKSSPPKNKSSPTKNKCDKCPEEFAESELLKAHMTSHSTPN